MTTFVICLCYCLLSVGTYFIWFSRWNVLAHMSLAFSVVAYIIPVGILHLHERFEPQLLDRFAEILGIGTLAYLLGLVIGAIVAGRQPTAKFRLRVSRFDTMEQTAASKRLIIALSIGIGITVIAAIVMGGLPLFTDDPLSAKYIKGDIKERYDQVSVLYRLGTGILTVLPPISLAMAVHDKARRGMWVVLTGVSYFLMVATLQRGPMAEGLLIVLGILLIWRRRYLLAGLLMIGSYIVGTLFYLLLDLVGLGVNGSGAPRANAPDLLSQIASTAPDVTDTLSFLTAWIRQGEPLTLGRTMWGGLVPGQFEWNPAVWSLVTQNYGANINDIRSGGLRLPLPVWGAANFGEFGLIALPLVVGIVSGFLVRRVASRIPSENRLGTITLTVYLNTMLLTIGSFYILGYLEVVKAAVLLWVLWPCLRITREERFELARAKDSGANGARPPTASSRFASGRLTKYR